MDEEMLKQIIVNLPNFIGLIYLAYVTDKRLSECIKSKDELVDRILDEREEADS